MTATVVAIFVIVYLGMILVGLPFLQLDCTGVALLGAIALVAIGDVTPEQAALVSTFATLGITAAWFAWRAGAMAF